MAIVTDKQTLVRMGSRSLGFRRVEDALEVVRRARADEDLEREEEALQAAFVVHAAHPDVWCALGVYEHERGHVFAARKAYERAVALRSPLAKLELARLEASVGDWDRAEALAQDLVHREVDEDLRNAARELLVRIAENRAG